MKTAVMGAGAVGSVFGGRLAAAGHEVWLIHRRAEVVNALRRDGLRLSTPDGLQTVRVGATRDPTEVGPVDVVLIMTKATDTADAARAARPLVADQTLVLTLQNGLGNFEVIGAAVGAERTLVGLTYIGATLGEPGAARLTAPGRSFIGEPEGRLSERVVELAQAFSAAGLPTEVAERIWDVIWGKLIINAAINASCALTGATGTGVLDSPPLSRWLALVAHESAAVARRLGIELPYPDAPARVLQHCRDVGDSKPSMLQDVERGRPTEIDAINGAIVRAAESVGLAAPYNEALVHLVKGKTGVA